MEWNVENVVGFVGERKTIQRKTSCSRTKPIANSTHIWSQVQKSNPGHIDGRRQCSHHYTTPALLFKLIELVLFSPQTFLQLDWYHYHVGYHCTDCVLHLPARNRHTHPRRPHPHPIFQPASSRFQTWVCARYENTYSLHDFIIWLIWSTVKRSILIGSLSSPYFAIQTAKLGHSQTDFDLYIEKDIQKDIFLALCSSRKYPYSPMKGFCFAPPTHQEIPVYFHILLQKI